MIASIASVDSGALVVAGIAAAVLWGQGRAERTRDAAFGHLRKAIQNGFGDPDQFASDPDLASLHHDPRWAEALGRMKRE